MPCHVCPHKMVPHGGRLSRCCSLQDVHHGNGIEQILYSRPDAMYISLHRWGGAASANLGSLLCN